MFLGFSRWCCEGLANLTVHSPKINGAVRLGAVRSLKSLLRPWAAILRLDRLVGSFLLLWPTLAALWLAAEGTPPTHLTLVFAAGVFIMRAAGCVVNDLADRRFDALVERTWERPLVTGAVTVRQALGLFAVLSLAALSLLFWLNETTRLLAVVGFGVSVLYPFTKRWTHLPQLVLGVAFSWGILMAFTAVTGGVPTTGWLLFVASLLWIVAYDTLYAMVDRPEDLKAGVKSTAILFGEADRLMVGILQGGALFGFAMVGTHLGFGVFYGLALVVILALFGYQQYLIRRRERIECFRAFLNNIWVGFALFFAVVLEQAVGQA